MRTLLLLAVLASAGCLRKTDYRCIDSAQCGTDGTCEDTGFCSFVDTECESGRRYGEYSGITFSNRCVSDGSTDPDASVDAVTDSGTDASNNCPVAYAQLGSSANRYRVITNTTNWIAHAVDCGNDTSGTNTYLAVPGDQTELTAILTAAGTATAWLGISDQNEGTYTTAAGGTFSATDPLWDTGEPDDNPLGGSGQGDCVVGVTASGQVADEGCFVQHAAVCECVP